MKTKIFKIYLDKDQQTTIDRWIETLRLVWNKGLELLLELEAYSAPYSTIEPVEGVDKKVWHRAACCPVQWEYRWLKGQRWESVDGRATIVPGDEKDWAAVPFSRRASRRPYRLVCPIIPCDPAIDWTEPSPFAYREPRLDQPSNFSLAKYFAHKRHPQWTALHEVPAWFIRGTCHSLAESWERYKARTGGKPRFKRKGDAVATLIYEDGKAIRVKQRCETIGVQGNDREAEISYVRVPNLGEFRVRHMAQAWGDTPIKVLKLAKRPNGFYLQLTGDVPTTQPKPSAIAATITLPQKQGVLYVDDRGKTVAAVPDDRKLLARLEKLQQRLARQVYLSKNWHKTKAKIARIHQKQAAQARSHNHKLSTFLVRQYGAITLEHLKPGTIPAPEPILDSLEPLHFAPNGATQVAMINQRRSALRAGQFIELVKQKAKAAGREVTIVKPAKTAKTAPADRVGSRAIVNSVSVTDANRS